MAFTLPRLLRRLGASLVHTQYALPLRCPCPAVVTIHDLSFVRDPSLMSRKDRFVFRRVVPRAARGAARVLTVSERTKRDLIDLYGVPDEPHRRHAERRRPGLSPGRRSSRFVRAGGRSDPGAEEPARRARCRRRRRAPARRRRTGQGRRARRRAPPPRRAPRGLRRHGAPRRPLPRRGLSRAALALRGLRPAGPRGDGVRDAGRRSPGAGARRGRGRRRRLRGRAGPRGWHPARRSRDATSSSQPGWSARRRSAGARPPRGRSPSTGRYSAREGLCRRRLPWASRRASKDAARARPAGRRDRRDRERRGLRRRRARRRPRPREPTSALASPRTSTSGSRRRRASTS